MVFYIASLIGLVGAILNVLYYKLGFVFFAINNVSVIVQAIYAQQYNLLITHIPFLITSIMGYYLWSQPGEGEIREAGRKVLFKGYKFWGKNR